MFSSEDLSFFAILASSTSLAECARTLNISPPAVTQRLRSLEMRAGLRLVERSGRGLHLTPEGELVADQAKRIGQSLAELAEALRERRQLVSGPLRIAASHGFGRRYVAPAVGSITAQHRNIVATLDLSEAPASRLVESRDLVIHIGETADPDQIVTTLAPNRRILCASPGYVAEARPLQSPEELLAHRCLVVRENEEDSALWRFSRKGQGKSFRVQPAMSSNDGEVVRNWAIAGMGVMIRSEWDVADDLAAGRLIEIMPNWQAPDADVVMLFHSRRGRTARVQAFADHLRRALTPVPWRQISRI